MALPVLVLPLAMAIDLLKVKRHRKGKWVTRAGQVLTAGSQESLAYVHCHQGSVKSELGAHRYDSNGVKTQGLGGSVKYGAPLDLDLHT